MVHIVIIGCRVCVVRGRTVVAVFPIDGMTLAQDMIRAFAGDFATQRGDIAA